MELQGPPKGDCQPRDGPRFDRMAYVRALFSCLLLCAKIFLKVSSACVLRPVCWCTLPKNILQIQPGATLDEKLDDLVMAGQCRLMQGCRVRMESDRVVPVWIFAGIEQQANDLNMTKLTRQGECAMTVFAAGGGKQPTEILNASQRCSNRQIDLSAAPDEGVRCLKLAVRDCRLDSGVWVHSMIAKEIDQWELHMTFTRHAAR